MTHLTDLEIVDQIDDVLPAVRAEHSAACPDCRAKVDVMRAALARTEEVEIPEPSPLFWEHFSARVHAGVADAPVRGSSWWSWGHGGAWKWAVPGLVLAVVVGAGVWQVAVSTRPDHTIAGGNAVIPTTGAGNVDPVDTPGVGDTTVDTDQAWALVRSVADEIEWNDGVPADLAVRPGWAERAALDLSSDELDELLRLLKAEAKRPGV
jgi:hypothetical protein